MSEPDERTSDVPVPGTGGTGTDITDLTTPSETVAPGSGGSPGVEADEERGTGSADGPSPIGNPSA